MSHDNVFALKNPAVPNEVRDALTEVLREGARTLLAQAIEAEVAEFLVWHAHRAIAGAKCRRAQCPQAHRSARERCDRRGAREERD